MRERNRGPEESGWRCASDGHALDNDLLNIHFPSSFLIPFCPFCRYNKIAGIITSLTAKLKQLPADNQYRIRTTEALLDKLYRMGLIDTASSLIKAERLSASAFCRRRLPVVMVRLKFAETLKEAVTFIEQGHVRVGPEVVTDPAFLVTRTMEDWITWTQGSKIQRAVARYNDKLDDYDLLGE